MKFSIKISSVNVTKSPDFLSHFCQIVNGKLHFLCRVKTVLRQKTGKIKAISLTKIMMVFDYWLWTLSFLSIWVRWMDGCWVHSWRQNAGLHSINRNFGLHSKSRNVGLHSINRKTGCTQWALDDAKFCN